MRVCTPHCGIAPESGSGGEVYERELLRDLAGLGVELHILLARGKPHDDVPGCRVHPVWPPKGLRWPVTPFVFPRYVKRVWDRHGFDLLRAHSVRYVGPAALRLQGMHLIGSSPEVMVRLEEGIAELKPIAGTRRRGKNEQEDRQLADELGLGTEHVRVVHCGVGRKYEPRARDRALARRFALEGRRVLLSLGPLIERKNPFFMLEVLRDVRGALGPDVVLVWIGAGPLRGPLERRARELGLEEAVLFTGYLPEAEKVAALNLADVFVFPSLLEGFPLAPQEAMSCGKPVVAFRVASLGEMVEDGATGFLTQANDRPAFAERVARLLRDEPLRARFGAAAAERVERHFRWDQTVRNVLKIYQEVVDDFGRRG